MALLVLPLFGAVVMRLAKRLPVTCIPEQRLITPMWFDVINYGSPYYPAVLLAHYTERML
jgi:hypothetical protein